jgi:hypothetical protein
VCVCDSSRWGALLTVGGVARLQDAQQYGKLHGRVVDAFARRYVERSPDKACFSVNLWAAYARGCNESAGARPSGAAGAAACSSVDAANAFVEIAARLAALLDGSGSFTLNRLALEFARRLFRVYDTTLDYFQHLQFVPAGPLQRGVAKLDGLMGELAQLVSVRASLNVTTPFSSSVAIADRDAYAALPSVRLRECLRQLLQLLSTCSVGSADRIVLQDAMRERDFVRMIFMLLAWRWPSEKVLLKNKLLRQAYDLLVHFVSGNRANQNAAIGLLPYMMRHAGYDVGVGNALCCLFDGNARLGASLPPATVSGIATLLLPRVSVADGAALSPGSSPQAADKAEQAAAGAARVFFCCCARCVCQTLTEGGGRVRAQRSIARAIASRLRASGS